MSNQTLDLVGAAAALYGTCHQEVNSPTIYIHGIPATDEQMLLLNAKALELTEVYAQAAINKKALAYLASTDWMVLRQADSGEAMPNSIKDARAAARLEIK
jgi:hypothetical protein